MNLLSGLVRSQSFYPLSEKDFEIEFGKHSKDQNEEKRDEQALIKSEQQVINIRLGVVFTKEEITKISKLDTWFHDFIQVANLFIRVFLVSKVTKIYILKP